MGGIDESAIDKLSSVCEFAKLIQTKSTQGRTAHTKPKVHISRDRSLNSLYARDTTPGCTNPPTCVVLFWL